MGFIKIDEPDRGDYMNKFITKFNKELNSWKYGILIDNKIITNPDLIDWKKYRTIPIEYIEKYHVGVCYDFVNYQHYIFKLNNIEHESYFFIAKKETEYITHTFNIITDNDDKYWFESSWKKYQGIHKVDKNNGWIKVVEKLCAEYEVYKFDIYKYNPDGLDNNLTGYEFSKKASEYAFIFSTQKTKSSKDKSEYIKNFKKGKKKN